MQKNPSHDQFYRQRLVPITPFAFDEKVALCFDDMVKRSVPFYDEIHRILCDLLAYHFNDHDLIVDLGCSTGTTMQILSNYLKDHPAQFLGVDQSSPMINKAREKLQLPKNHQLRLWCQDLIDIKIPQCQVVILNYTLQFIEPSKRQKILSDVFASLKEGGIFILTEKIACQNGSVEKLLTDLYYDFKRRNGYSELEISQKREALEKVLIPLQSQDHLRMLKTAGFIKTEMIFRWYNFACFIGIK